MADDKKAEKEAKKAKKKAEKEAKKANKKEGEKKSSKGKSITEKKSPKGLIKKLFFGFIFFIILGIGSFAGYYFMFSPNVYHKIKLDKIKISEELIQFGFKQTPEIYKGLVETNNRLVLIENEIKRLTQIEEEFPDQKTFTTAEITTWENLQLNLQTLIESLEKNIEMYYVSFHVNTDKGKKLIESNKEALTQSMKKSLESSDEMMNRLKEQNQSKGLIQKLKNKL